MSYDLRLFAVPAGVEVEAAYEQLIQQEEAEVGNVDERAERTLSEFSRARMQELADAFRARWTAFVQFVPKSPLPCGYTAFDPQLGRAVTADDCDSMIDVYHRMDAAIPGIRGGDLGKKRWWKFWSQ